jgi:hypothetical protein
MDQGKQQTAVEWLINEWPVLESNIPPRIIEQAKAIEKDQIIRAIIYALDEDGHTGDWKIKFANDYYNKLNKGYDIRNTTRERFFGDPTFQTP